MAREVSKLAGMGPFPRRYFWWLLFLIVIVAGAGSAYCWKANPKGVNWINYCKIRPAMKYEDVAALLGPPSFSMSINGRVGMTGWQRPDGSGFAVFTDAKDCVMFKSSYHSDNLKGRLESWLFNHGI
jgi:hypothetical protein